MKTLFRLFTSLALCALCLTACQDDEFMSMPLPSTPPSTSDTRAVNATSSLVQNTDGTWTATRRVPLVGRGRVVDDYSPALVSALSGNSQMGNITDTDLTNSASFGGGLASVDALGNQLLSVRDMNFDYAGGQTVGFVYKVSDSGLLTANVLKGFWIKTFLNGTEQELKGGKTEGEALELNLISIAQNDGIQEISFTTSVDKPFDEVQIGIYGISANLLQALSICYAYVGDNPIKTATQGSIYFPEASLHENSAWAPVDYSWESMINAGHVVDNDTTNSAYFGTLSELLDDPRVTVRFGKEVPAGSEVGFMTSSVDILSIDIGGSIILTTFDDDDQQQDQMSITSVLGVSAVSAGKSAISMVTKKPCTQVKVQFSGLSVSLGGTVVYYAFARDAVTVDASSYFSGGEITITGNSFNLPTPEGGKTSWVVTGYVEGTQPSVVVNADGTQKIVNMTKDGTYILSGTYTPSSTETRVEGTDTRGDKAISVTFVIHRQSLTMDEGCDQTIGTAYGATVENSTGGGQLISIIEYVKDKDNIVDDNKDTYATYVNGLSLAANTPIVSIKLANPINPDSETIRTGFTMQTAFDFLSADVLKFFLIKLYNDGKEVLSRPVNDSSAADIGLIGSKGNKVRVGIETIETFDRIELWSAGVLSLGISEYRIYNAYWESAEADCYTGAVEEACMELLTTAHGASINYDVTKAEGLLNVANSYNKLGDLLDDDKETYATIGGVANVLGATTVGVTFDEMVGHRQIGFILEMPDYVANVDLLSGITLEVYNNGVEQTQVSEGGVLNLGALGNTGRTYVEADVPQGVTFDEIRIHFPSTLSALEQINLYGVYIRRDSNNNDIPDCADDDENVIDPTPDTQITGITVLSDGHICEPEDMVLQCTLEGTEEEIAGELTKDYVLVCYNTSKANEQTRFQMKMVEEDGNGEDDDKKYKFVIPGLEAGVYFIYVYTTDGKRVGDVLEAYVHPLQTTWKQSPANTDWNNWNNWTEGAPWTCTNVIIPGGCTDYPVLKEDADNYCANLHISAGGEIVNTQYFTNYDYAWVELSMQPNTYYMLSAPLKDMVTGDMFVPESWNFGNSAKDYFTALTSITAPESRFTPRVYQRFWAREVPGKIISDGTLANEVIVSQTDWTAPFNAVAEAYDRGMGFSASITGAATFRFPKEHREYTYFDGAGNSTGQIEGVARNTQNVGRFWTDDWTNGDSFTVTSTNLEASETFVVGNPFMAHINIRQFLKTNPNINEVKLYDGNSIVTITNEEATETGYTHIEPMQAFYVTATAGTSLEVTFNAAMQEAKPGYQVMNAPAVQTRAETRGLADNGNRNTLRLTATCDSRNTSCLVRLSPSADDAYRTGEDSRLLIDTQAEPTVAVFTVADGKALDIQQRRSGTDIPVGLRMKRQGRVTLTLSHRAGDDWTGWTLVDRQTGRRYPLTDGYTYIDLGTTDTTTDRLYLTRE